MPSQKSAPIVSNHSLVFYWTGALSLPSSLILALTSKHTKIHCPSQQPPISQGCPSLVVEYFRILEHFPTALGVDLHPTIVHVTALTLNSWISRRAPLLDRVQNSHFYAFFLILQNSSGAKIIDEEREDDAQ